MTHSSPSSWWGRCRTVAATSHPTATHSAHQIPGQWLQMQVNTWLSAREDRVCYQQPMTQGRQLASVWQALCAPTDSRPTVLTQRLGPVGQSTHCRAMEAWGLGQWPGMSLSPCVLTFLTLKGEESFLGQYREHRPTEGQGRFSLQPSNVPDNREGNGTYVICVSHR